MRATYRLFGGGSGGCRAAIVLVSLLATLTVLYPAAATRIPDAAYLQLKRDIALHMEDRLALKGQQADETPEQAAARWRTRLESREGRALLQAPATIRIEPEFQISSLTAAQQETVRTAVSVAIQTIQLFFKVKYPVGANGFLHVPRDTSAAVCSGPNGPCLYGPGLRPDFENDYTSNTNDIRAPYCNVAVYNRSHFLAAACTSGGAGCPYAEPPASDPSDRRGGLLVDSILYVTSSPSTCSGIAGYATPCAFDLTTNRPWIGMLNLCPAAIAYTFDDLLATSVHEIIHAMGFVSSLYDAWVDDSLDLIPVSSVLGTVAASGNPAVRSDYSYIKSPTVLTEVCTCLPTG